MLRHQKSTRREFQEFFSRSRCFIASKARNDVRQAKAATRLLSDPRMSCAAPISSFWRNVVKIFAGTLFEAISFQDRTGGFYELDRRSAIKKFP